MPRTYGHRPRGIPRLESRSSGVARKLIPTVPRSARYMYVMGRRHLRAPVAAPVPLLSHESRERIAIRRRRRSRELLPLVRTICQSIRGFLSFAGRRAFIAGRRVRAQRVVRRLARAGERIVVDVGRGARRTRRRWGSGLAWRAARSRVAGAGVQTAGHFAREQHRRLRAFRVGR